METPHGLAAGDKVRLISTDKQHDVRVTSVEGNSFTVEGWTNNNTEKVFVYGKQVDDFRTVDYDRIFTLNVSATQELSRQVDDLKKQLADRDAQFSAALDLLQTLQQEVITLKTTTAAASGVGAEGK